jgi:hypothetical protein
MNKTLLSAIFAACALLSTHGYAANADCEAKAMDKNGKPLAGAAKTSYMKKCEKDAGPSACDAQAADKKLAGAAKASFVKKCNADAAKK